MIIICRICNREIQHGKITNHVREAHGMSPEKYYRSTSNKPPLRGHKKRIYCAICCSYLNDIILREHLIYIHKISMNKYYSMLKRGKYRDKKEDVSNNMRFNNQTDKDYRTQSIKNKLAAAEADYKNATGTAKSVWWRSVKELRAQLREVQKAKVERRR